MTDACYRSGQAAREWGISSYEVRRLCEAGLVDAEFTAGKQWKIPAAEVARLKRDGVPPIPSPPEASRPSAAPSAKRAADHGLLAAPSPDVVEAAEDVAITESRLKRRKIDRELEETEDWFREREDREAARIEAQERERHRQAEAEQERRAWTDKWLAHALDSLPYDAPAEARLDVQEQIEAALAKLHPTQPDYTVERLVKAAAGRGLAPWRRRKELEKAIEAGCDGLPWTMRHDSAWKHRAALAAGEAITRLRDGASSAEMEAAAAVELKPLVAEYEHQKRCNDLADSTRRLLPDGSYDEREHGKEVLAEALAKLAVGASERQLEAAAAEALEPIRATVAARQDRELRQELIRWAGLPWGLSQEAQADALEEIQEALDALPPGTARAELEKARDRVVEQYRQEHEQQEKKERLIETGLQQIYPYLQKLEREGEFDKSTWTLEQEIKQPIRERLEDELSGNEPEEQVRNRVRRLVREELGL